MTNCDNEVNDKLRHLIDILHILLKLFELGLKKYLSHSFKVEFLEYHLVLM